MSQIRDIEGGGIRLGINPNGNTRTVDRSIDVVVYNYFRVTERNLGKRGYVQ